MVADLATGARLLSARADDFAHLDVAADGTLLADGSDIGVFTIMPSGLRQGVPDGEFLTNARFAGSAIAAIEETESDTSRPVVLAADAIHPHAIGLPSSTIDVVDADARGVAWIANDCVLYATLDAVAPAEPPAGPCARAEVEIQRRQPGGPWPQALPRRGVHRRDGRGLQRHGHDPRDAASAAAASSTSMRGKSRRFSVRFTRRSVRAHPPRGAQERERDPRLTTRLADGGPPDREGAVFVDKVRRFIQRRSRKRAS